MSQKYRFVKAAFPLVLLTVLVFGIAFAGGNEEQNGAATPGPPGPAPTDPFAGDTLDQAIAEATAIPDSWDYDPSSRQMHPEGADIAYPIRLDDAVWHSRLSEFEYYVLREQGTEYAFSNPMHENKASGIYYSRATGQPLFSSEDKYDSRTGWPSFTRPINPNAIVYISDNSLYPPRIEVVDSLSGSHLGHVFPDGPPPTRQRYCINAAALIFVPEGEDPPPILAEVRALAVAE